MELNGKYINLGNYADVKNNDADRAEHIKITYDINDGHTVCLDMYAENADETCLRMENDEADKLRAFEGVVYISAERIGPRLVYDNKDGGGVQAHGDNSVKILYEHRDKLMRNEYFDHMTDFFPLMDVDGADKTVLGQVQFWMTQMFGKTTIHTSYVNEANIYTLKVGTGGHKPAKPTNVGFGYTYMLPILVAGLTAKEGAVVIIENPEAHLHPAAQSKLAIFLAIVARCGVQIFIETHSEHFVNAFRVLVVQRHIENTQTNVMFFSDQYQGKTCIHIPIQEDGSMDEWPKDFFDQSEKDLQIILGY